MIRKNYHNSQQGLALIELLIALALGSLLMLGVTRMFADSVANSSSERALAQVQESARIAMDILKRDIRMAGYQGAAPGSTVPEYNSIVDLSLSALNILPNPNRKKSDLLVIGRAFDLRRSEDLADPAADISPVKILSFYDPGHNNKMVLDRAICFKANHVFLATNGHKVATFKFKGAVDCSNNPADSKQILATKGADNHPVDLSTFAVPADCDASSTDTCPQLYSLGTRNGVFYRTQEQNNANGETVSALFRDGVELVEGVENMQILLGITSADGSTTKYQEQCSSADVNSGNCNITHVKISLIVSSSFDVLAANTQQKFPILNTQAADSVWSKNDRRLRRVFTTTIQLRNRGSS